MKRVRDIFAGVFLLALFWGILYPQYALTEDVCIKKIDGEAVVRQDASEDLWNLLSEEADQVNIRLSIFETFKEKFGER